MYTWYKCNILSRPVFKGTFKIFVLSFFHIKEVQETQQQHECEVLTDEQKKQLEELQLFKNKEGNVSIEVSL